jgi:hypothetical protein
MSREADVGAPMRAECGDVVLECIRVDDRVQYGLPEPHGIIVPDGENAPKYARLVLSPRMLGIERIARKLSDIEDRGLRIGQPRHRAFPT